MKQIELPLSDAGGITVKVRYRQCRGHRAIAACRDISRQDDYFTVYEETRFSTGAGQVRKHGGAADAIASLRTVVARWLVMPRGCWRCVSVTATVGSWR